MVRWDAKLVDAQFAFVTATTVNAATIGNASAVIRDEFTNTDKTVNVYSDGLYVGDQPQTQVGGNARYQVTKKLDTLRTRLFNEWYEHGYIKS